MEENKVNTQEKIIAEVIVKAEKPAKVEKPAKTDKKEFVNPFTEGVNYEMFLEAVEKETVASYCKGQLTDEEIEWLEKDIKLIKKQK